MTPETHRTCIAFSGTKLVAKGSLREVALRAKALVDSADSPALLVFDGRTSELVEIDLRGTPDDVVRRLPAAAAGEAEVAERSGDAATPRTPGRPKLGVVAREVTLLPRHWEWLASQPGGASVSLRKLVEAARRSSGDEDRRRAAQESAFRFMNAMAGNEPDFEEALRAFFAGDRELFEALVAPWPPDVRDHATQLAASSFPPGTPGR